MALFMRVVKRVASKAGFDLSDRRQSHIATEVGVNTIVTGLHITLIIAFTILTCGEELIYPQLGTQA